MILSQHYNVLYRDLKKIQDEFVVYNQLNSIKI